MRSQKSKVSAMIQSSLINLEEINFSSSIIEYKQIKYPT